MGYILIKSFVRYHSITVTILVLLALCFVLVSKVQAQEREQSIKLGYIYNFLQFMNWPKQSFKEQTIHFCLYGENPFGSMLFELNKKQVSQKHIDVAHIKNLALIDNCHAVFISQSEQSELQAIFARIGNQHILTISEIRAFSRKGGQIGMKIKSSRLSIEINLKAIKHAGLSVSSPLMHVSKLID